MREMLSTYNLDTFYVPMWLWNSLLSRAWYKSVCNHGTAAMMAVTALLGKMLASSRGLDSVLDTSRLKHAIIHANPRLLIVRMVEMVPAVPDGNLHLDKNLQNAKIQIRTHVLASWHFARTAHQRILNHLQKQLHCAKIVHVVQDYAILGTIFATFGRTFIESPQPSSNGSMLDPIKCWIVTPSFFLRSNVSKLLRTNKRQARWKRAHVMKMVASRENKRKTN